MSKWEEAIQPYRTQADREIPRNGSTKELEAFLTETVQISGELRKEKVRLYNLIADAKKYENELKQIEKTLEEKRMNVNKLLKSF